MKKIKTSLYILLLLCLLPSFQIAGSTVDFTASAALVADFTLNPSTIDLGIVLIGDTATVSVDVVADTKFRGAIILTQPIVTNGASSGFFISAPLGMTQLVQGQATSFEIGFRPSNAGTFTGEIVLGSSIGTKTVTVVARAVNLLSITVQPALVDFGLVDLGSSAVRSVTISAPTSNSTTVNILSVQISNGATSGFSLASSPAITALRPGQSTSFEVLYKPTSLAAATGTVTIMSSGGAATVQLAANRSRAEIDVNPTAVDFGTVAFGQAASRLITIRNQGNAPLSISRIVFDVTSDKRFSLSSQPISSIPVGGSENLQVDFKASSSGVATASLLIASDGGNVTVSLKANSVDFEPPRVAISSPVGAESIVAGSQFPIRFSVTDNDLVSGVVLSYSLDGGISIASDIARLGSPAAGTQQSFVWNVPDLVSSAQAVVKVTAIDRSGNSGTAISNSFSIQVPQTTAAVLRVIVSFDPPTAGQFSPPQNVRLNAFERKTATEIDSLQSTNQVGDPGTLIGYNIYRIFVVDDKQPLPQQIVSPANLVGSISADKNSFTDDISTVKGNNVAYSVTSLFGTGGESQGSPPVATNLPVVKNPRFGSGTIFIDGPGSFIQPGATLIVNDTDTFSLQLDSTGIQYTVSKREPSKPSGAKIKKLVKKGKSVKLNVQNPDGKLSVSVSFIRS